MTGADGVDVPISLEAQSMDIVDRIVASKWYLALKVMPFVGVFLIAKLAMHQLGWEVIALGPVLTSLIAATVFLLGFLIAGTLSDYKESERLPGEVAAIIETMADDCRAMYESKRAPIAKECLLYLRDLMNSMLDWLAKEERTNVFLGRIAGLGSFFIAFEPLTQPNFIVRLKQEQNLLRRAVMRIDTIRDTEFVKAGYTIAQIATGLLILAFLLTDVEPYYESLFLFGAVTFLLLYILFLIEDLDNPFSYNSRFSGSRVSRKHLRDTLARIELEIEAMDAVEASPAKSDLAVASAP